MSGGVPLWSHWSLKVKLWLRHNLEAPWVDNVFDKQCGAVARMPESFSFSAQKGFLKSWHVKSIEEWASATVPPIFLAPDFSVSGCSSTVFNSSFPSSSAAKWWVESLILMSQKRSQGPCTILTWHDAFADPAEVKKGRRTRKLSAWLMESGSANFRGTGTQRGLSYTLCWSFKSFKRNAWPTTNASANTGVLCLLLRIFCLFQGPQQWSWHAEHTCVSCIKRKF